MKKLKNDADLIIKIPKELKKQFQDKCSSEYKVMSMVVRDLIMKYTLGDK